MAIWIARSSCGDLRGPLLDLHIRRHTFVLDDVAILGPDTQSGVDGLRSTGLSHHPWPLLPGRLMTHMLRMATSQVGYPVTLVIQMKPTIGWALPG